MPSITYWSRLEPRSRTTDVGDSLAARVRDPAWLLARQWQLGEFQGEDAGSPAYIRIQAQVGDALSWGTPGEYRSDIGMKGPIERYITSEPPSPDDLARAVEVGQTLDRILVELSATDLRPHFLAAYPISPRDESEPRAARLRALWIGRAIDGLAVWRATTQPVAPPPPGTPPGTPPPPAGTPWSVPLAHRTIANQAVVRTAIWVYETGGAAGVADPAGWRPAELEYDLRVYVSAPQGGVSVLAATPDRRGDVAWHAFDEVDEPVPPSGLPDPVVTEIRRAVIPHHVRFRGMPNERFWDFEDARFDVAAIRPDRRNLASMLLTDFMLVHGNDWYLVPFEQPVGTVCQAELIVVDVFGESTTVPRADAEPPPAPAFRRFSMFSTASSGGGFADTFIVAVSAATSVLESTPLEQVRFLRDESANLAWAVEHAVEASLGRAQLGSDRAPPTAAPELEPLPDGGLRYRIQSAVPPHWFPFLPVKLEGTDHQIALERAALLPLDQGAAVVPVPLGKILAPQSVPTGTPYRVREERIPREGTRVTRLVRRARGADGSTHVWIERTRSVGTGEAWSGLRFDLAKP